MTTDQFIAKQNAKMQALIKDNRPLLLAVQTTMAARSKRIFLDGQNSKGGIIGKYKQYPEGEGIYISGNARPAPKKPLTGKNGIAESKKVYSTKTKKALKTQSAHRSKYFANFVAYKKDVGRQQGVQTVDLFLTGDLHKNWAGVANIAQPPRVNKLNANTYVEYLSKESKDKVSRYRNVFTISASERALFYKVFQGEFTKAMQ